MKNPRDATPVETAGARNFVLFRNNFLPASETFIHDELRFHRRYSGVVFCRRRLNENRFPNHKLVCLSDGFLGRADPLQALYLTTGLHPRFIEAIRRLDPALVHAHFGHNGIYALPTAKAARKPLVVSLHGRDVTMLIGPDRYHPRWLYYTRTAPILFQQADLFLAASTELAELAQEAGCPAHKIRIHRLGVDLDRFRPQGDHAHPASPTSPGDPGGKPGPRLPRPLRALEHAGPVVCMVGRFVEKKGFEYGIRAFAKTLEALPRKGNGRRRPRPMLVIIGSGPRRPLYEQLVSDLDLGDRVLFPGPLSQDGVAACMARSALVMTPSVVASNLDRESGLIVAKEAAATGLPVVGTWHGGIPEIVAQGETGFLVPERNVEGLAEALTRLLTDDDLRRRMGVAARKKMEREYDIRQSNEELERIYDEVAPERN